MDYVITYVNSSDPAWQATYKAFQKQTPTKLGTEKERFRDQGFLKYHFRALEKNLPFINNVYLVVSQESQVPEWLNRDTVHVVTHKEIMPPECLPTFNSTAIEMFLHNIPGLSEEFIYANDDVFPVHAATKQSFIIDGKPCVHLLQKKIINATTQFRKVIINSQDLVLPDYPNYPLPDIGKYYRTEHFSLCHLKSVHEEVWQNHKDEILKSISPFREVKNYNQYIFLFASVFANKAVDVSMNGAYYEILDKNLKSIINNITSGNKTFLCLNDCKLSSELDRVKITQTFDSVFPIKSRFET